ncbi:hypothetical protein HMPREF1247_0104 [Atopobium sp. BV3Ac4]|nr:hypothetical protein HMPREF1247_0104 [Atopobium sp. BV3Ac4]
MLWHCAAVIQTAYILIKKGRSCYERPFSGLRVSFVAPAPPNFIYILLSENSMAIFT